MLAGGRGSGGGPRGKGGMELKRRENIVSRVSERSSQRGKKMVLGARVERRNIEGPGCVWKPLVGRGPDLGLCFFERTVGLRGRWFCKGIQVNRSVKLFVLGEGRGSFEIRIEKRRGQGRGGGDQRGPETDATDE